MASIEELVQAAKDHAGMLTPDEVASHIAQGALLLDVRETGEWAAGHLPGASHIPRGVLEFKIRELEPDLSRRIVVYCAGGARAAMAASRLKELGYDCACASAAGFEGLR